jgi:uncharacterized membrane protein
VSERSIRGAIAAFALAGSALSAYIVYVRYSGATLACSSGGCETVQRSSYSALLGVPVAVLGLGAYLVLFATSLSRHDLARAAGLSIAFAGLAFSAYLLYVQLAVIGAVCDWCLASDVVMTVLAALSALRVHAAMQPAPA